MFTLCNRLATISQRNAMVWCASEFFMADWKMFKRLDLQQNERSIINCHWCEWLSLRFDKTSLILLQLLSKQFDLVCDRDIYPTIGLSALNTGGPIGVYLFGMLNDRAGRRVAFFTCLATLLFGSFLTAASVNFWMWTTSRVIVGLTIPAVYQIPFIIGKSRNINRKHCIICSTNDFSTGIGWTRLSFICYSNDLHILHFWNHDVSRSNIFGAWLVPNELNYVDAISAIFSVYFCNAWVTAMASGQRTIRRSSWYSWSYGESKWKRFAGFVSIEIIWTCRNGENSIQEKCFSCWTIRSLQVRRTIALNCWNVCTHFTSFHQKRTPNMRLKTLLITLSWFANESVYVGMSYYGPSLGNNQYFSFFLSSLVEIPSYMWCWFLMDHWGRRWPMCLLMIIR